MVNKILVILITGTLLLGISKLSFAMMCHGQGGQHSRHQQITQSDIEQKQEAVDAPRQGASQEAVNVGNKICPVSGEKINEKIKATYEYEGKIYNFCCPMCIEEFKKDPKIYIKKVGEELQAESKGKEVEQKMQLEHETESAGDEDVHRGHHHQH